nr:reverse transcriptase domain-containing protein [Tanacetum cinerariifolium]
MLGIRRVVPRNYNPKGEKFLIASRFPTPPLACAFFSLTATETGNPTFLLHKEIALPEVIHEIHDSKGCNFLSEDLPDIDSFNDIHPHFDDDPLSGSTTYSANSLLEEFADEFTLISEDSDFKDSIDQSVLTHCDDLFVDPTPEMFTDEQPPDYSFPPRFDVYPDDLLEIESNADNFDDDLFDFEGEKIKEVELLIDQLDLPCDILSEYDSFNSQDFSRDDVLPSPDNEDKGFNPGILIHEKSVKIITRVIQEKKLAISFASLLFEDSDPPFYDLLVFKEVPNSMRLLLFSSKNEEKVFKPGIYTSKKFHCCFLSELSHPDDEPMWDADCVVASTLGFVITIPKTTNEFAIKGNHLTLVKGNQFGGRTKTDPHKHIHKFLRIRDMFKYKDTKNEAVRLMMFPISLTGEVKTWLDELNEGTIETWDELRTAFISRFFPLALLDRLLREIRAFSQLENESLTDAWLCSSNPDTDKIMARMDAMIIKMDAEYKELKSRTKQSTPDLDGDEIPINGEDENSKSKSDTKEPPFEKITINTDFKIKTSLEEPPMDLELKTLHDNFEYVFLEESSFLPVVISSKISAQNKSKLISVLKRHKKAFAWKTTDIPESVKVFMDDFFVFGDSFNKCLNNLDKMLQRCKDAHLVLNWKKCHFMVKEGIVLGHKVSSAGLEVDKAKIDVISKLPSPTNIKGVRSFLGHAGFYRHFIKDFSKITRPLTKLLEKDTPFEFSDDCQKAFEILKKKLTCSPVIVSPNWNLPFELMCDASDFTVRAVLGQKDGKNFYPIYFASKTLNPAQQKYTVTKKELMAVVFAFKKFRS